MFCKYDHIYARLRCFYNTICFSDFVIHPEARLLYIFIIYKVIFDVTIMLLDACSAHYMHNIKIRGEIKDEKMMVE